MANFQKNVPIWILFCRHLSSHMIGVGHFPVKKKGWLNVGLTLCKRRGRRTLNDVLCPLISSFHTLCIFSVPPARQRVWFGRSRTPIVGYGNFDIMCVFIFEFCGSPSCGWCGSPRSLLAGGERCFCMCVFKTCFYFQSAPALSRGWCGSSRTLLAGGASLQQTTGVDLQTQIHLGRSGKMMDA